MRNYRVYISLFILICLLSFQAQSASVMYPADSIEIAERILCFGDGDYIDTDNDGLCDARDLDDDNDGCADIVDDNPLRAGVDTDGDGFANACDGDDDNDGVLDINDPEKFNPYVCGDSDNDGCDDCAIGVDQFNSLIDIDPANDGPDANSDGICDTKGCGSPQNLATIPSSWFFTTLVWDEVQGAISYQVEVKLTFMSHVINSATVYTNEYRVHLRPSLDYEFRVRANCGEGFADWSGWQDFTMSLPFHPISSQDQADQEGDGLFSTASFGLYPNPTTGVTKLNYSGPELKDAQLMISDVSGRVHYDEAIILNSDETLTLDLSKFENGMYMVVLMNNGDLVGSHLLMMGK